jgi:gluconokinase
VSAILAVDIGTTSAKALVITDAGHVQVSERIPYPTHRPHPGYAEQDADQLAQSIATLIRGVVQKVNGKIDVVTFSSAMHSVMAVDKYGRPLTPLIIWADLRAKDEAAQLRRDHGDLHATTGTPIHPMSPLAKILWLKNHQPEIFSQAVKFIGIKEYLWHRWFGEYCVDHSLASATGLFDANHMNWSPDALALAGIPEEKLSRVVPVHSPFQSEALNLEFGLPLKTPWIIGSSDGCLANLGSGAIQAKTLSLTVGTSGAVRMFSSQFGIDPHRKTFCYCLDKNRWVKGGATNNGAVLLDWYTEKFLPRPVDLKTFCETAARVTAGSEGLLMLPYLQGERSPVYDADASGAFLGVRHHHGHPHFMRAILEGISFGLWDIALSLADANQQFEIRASGGLSLSPHAMQIISDVFGKTIHVAQAEDASAIGAAMVACEALQIDFHSAVGSGQTYHPDSRNHERYVRLYAVYKSIYAHLADDLHQLISIQSS